MNPELNTIYCGDCVSVLSGWPDGCIDCCVTSPPYYGLRDYGVDGQIGLEESPEAYIAKLVDVFREVRRVLKPEGTLWLNLGDSYCANATGSSGDKMTFTGGRRNQDEAGKRPDKLPAGYKPKDLLMIPAQVALALRADGWYLRSDIIWHKPNPMPESVTDRPTSAHEHVFLLSKSARYWYDADAIAEPSVDDERIRLMKRGTNPKFENSDLKANHLAQQDVSNPHRNSRNVWAISTIGYPGAHFATFPPELPRRCILAGCPLGGVVLDPFFGSGTVGEVATQLGRKWVGCELNPEYVKLARKRTAQKGLPFTPEAA